MGCTHTSQDHHTVRTIFRRRLHHITSRIRSDILITLRRIFLRAKSVRHRGTLRFVLNSQPRFRPALQFCLSPPKSHSSVSYHKPEHYRKRVLEGPRFVTQYCSLKLQRHPLGLPPIELTLQRASPRSRPSSGPIWLET